MQFANIQWNDQLPYSRDFNDIYYSLDDGLAETEHVFIQHNQLTARFAALKNNETFTITEMGFGTGLNFFCTLQHFLSHAPAHAKLQFVSIERYPLNPQDFTKANQHWPMFSEHIEALRNAYQHLQDGINTFQLCDNRITLALWIGDINDCLPNMQTMTDAWFLDGFAPSQNSDMWSETLFSNLARLSKPQTTFSTFTSAGVVRRGLQNVGFKVNKVTGFGKKREMLSGYFLEKAL